MLLDRSPLGYTSPPSTEADFGQRATPLDLHFLGTPQAFVLSQDQTLRQKNYKN